MCLQILPSWQGVWYRSKLQVSYIVYDSASMDMKIQIPNIPPWPTCTLWTQLELYSGQVQTLFWGPQRAAQLWFVCLIMAIRLKKMPLLFLEFQKSLWTPPEHSSNGIQRLSNGPNPQVQKNPDFGTCRSSRSRIPVDTEGLLNSENEWLSPIASKWLWNCPLCWSKRESLWGEGL